jgi:hypothetical protein
MARVRIAEFGAVQKTLAGASVAIYEADSNGESTGTLATIYQASTGSAERGNPITLNEDGKLPYDCYVALAVVAAISNISETVDRSLRKIRLNPLMYPLPVTSSSVNAADVATDAATASAAATTATTQAGIATTAATTATTQAGIATTQAGNAATSAGNAATSETNAAASAASAASAAAEGLYRDHIDIAFGDSPYVPLVADEGVIYRVNTSGGNVVINLSALSSYAEDMKFAFVKTTGDANTITINRGGTDTINGATSTVISTQYETHALIGDQSSGTWIDIVQSTGIADGSIVFAKFNSAAVASQAEAETGSASDKIMTPQRTQQKIDYDTPTIRLIPQNSKSTDYTLVLADQGKHILHPAADTNTRTFTIPANASVAYVVGTAITFVNETSQVLSIAITTDTLTLAGTTTTGTRSLAQNGVATAIKVTSTKWIISGTGLS